LLVVGKYLPARPIGTSEAGCRLYFASAAPKRQSLAFRAKDEYFDVPPLLTEIPEGERNTSRNKPARHWRKAVQSYVGNIEAARGFHYRRDERLTRYAPYLRTRSARLGVIRHAPSAERNPRLGVIRFLMKRCSSQQRRLIHQPPLTPLGRARHLSTLTTRGDVGPR
jgi:hypothetical protein